MTFKKISRFLLSAVLLFGSLSLPEISRANTTNYGSLTIGCVAGAQNGLVVPQTSATFAACTIAVYNHGTTTLAGVYSNATGSVVTNPIVVAAATQTYQFFAADGQYDVCVYNASSTPVLQSSCNYGLTIFTGTALTGSSNANKAVLLTAFTDANASGLQAITGLSFTFPSTFVGPVAFHCGLGYSEATPAAGVGFGLAVLTTAPTRVDAVQITGSAAAGTQISGPITNLTTTTPTAFGTVTPGSTVVYHGFIDGTAQLAGSGAATLQLYIQQGTAANVVVIAAGSYCVIF